MSEISRNLLGLFMQIVHKPDLMMAVQGVTDKRRINEDGSHRGSRGLLLYLEKKGDGLTNSEIADTSSIKPSSVTAMVKQLEQDDLIYRLVDEDDKRISRIYLTSKGRQDVKERKKHVDKVTEEIFASLTLKEQEELFHLLTKLDSSLETKGKVSKKCISDL
ncbi:MarR family transcriptional regulator [Streptococcaceae bacterium ESL0687]|nr:MarR family transcriptional regulator [Streptococcaceae bacterium ESL0687]